MESEAKRTKLEAMAAGDPVDNTPPLPRVIQLNIGGLNYTTLLSTLTKESGSLLADMFSGKHDLTKDDNGRYFIDADGDMFTHILNWLRVEQLPPPDVSIEVSRHAEYFGIQSLVNKLQKACATQTKKQAAASVPKICPPKVRKKVEVSTSKVHKTAPHKVVVKSTAASVTNKTPSALLAAQKKNLLLFGNQEEENRTNLIINYLPQALSDAAFNALFIPIGPIIAMKVCRDKNGRSYGFGFVEFRHPEDAQKAIYELNGKEIMNKRIKVALVQKRAANNKGASICVKNLPKHYSDDDLRDMFTEYGNVIHTNVLKNHSKLEESKGVGFVVFEKEMEAERAISRMNDVVPPGGELPLVVKTAEDKAKTPKAPSPPKRPNPKPANRPSQVPNNVRNPVPEVSRSEIMPTTGAPGAIMGNRPGPVLPHGPRPLMPDGSDQLMANTIHPLMRSMTNEMMDNGADQMMGNGLGQMMGNNQGNLNDRIMNPTNMAFNYMNNKSMGDFMKESVTDALRNVQPNPPFAHNPGLNQCNFFSAPMSMERPDMHRPVTTLGCCLFVRNLDFDCEQTDVYRLFAPYGALLKVDVVRDKETNHPKGYAFVTFINTNDAEMAIQMLDGSIFKGRQLQVSFKK